MGFLAGKRVLIVGVASKLSIASGIAAAMHREGAELAFTIAQVRRYKEFALAAHFHAHQALVPALDHPAGADHALEGFAAIIGGIERAAIFEKSVVLGGDQRTFDHFPAVTQLNIFDHQFVAH